MPGPDELQEINNLMAKADGVLESGVAQCQAKADELRQELEAFEAARAKTEPEEGGPCPKCLLGKLILPPVENCNCHSSPPCSACADNKLKCNDCEWVEGDDITPPAKTAEEALARASERARVARDRMNQAVIDREESIAQNGDHRGNPEDEAQAADELQQQLEALKVAGQAATNAIEAAEIASRERCIEEPSEGCRCPKRATTRLEWPGEQYPSMLGYCDEHAAPFKGSGATLIEMAAEPTAPLKEALQQWNGGEPEKVAESPLVIPPVRAPEVPVGKEVPLSEMCIFDFTSADGHACKKRATVYVRGITSSLYCDEHFPMRTTLTSEVTRIKEWVDVNPVPVEDEAQPVVRPTCTCQAFVGEGDGHCGLPGLAWVAEDHETILCARHAEIGVGLGIKTELIPENLRRAPHREGARVGSKTIELPDPVDGVKPKAMVEFLKDLRGEILDLCVQRYGAMTDITVYETLGVLRVVEHDLMDMLEKHNDK